MTTRILLAVDDSPGGLAAARTAVRLAARLRAPLRAVHVLVDGDVARRLESHPASGGVRGRRDQGAVAVLRFVSGLAAQAGVDVETVALEGQPARCILQQGSAWSADIIVLGRAAGRRLGQPYVGSEVRQVLEFADVPVLVVPPP